LPGLWYIVFFFSRPVHLTKLYGPSGIILYLFGSRTTWRTEAHVLGRLNDSDARDFKKSVQDECTMISVAVSLSLHRHVQYDYIERYTSISLSLPYVFTPWWKFSTASRSLEVIALVYSLFEPFTDHTRRPSLPRLLSHVCLWIISARPTGLLEHPLSLALQHHSWQYNTPLLSNGL
jgi:hypothetical protein